MLRRPLAPGVLDQDAAHRLGGGGEEVAAVLPVLVALWVCTDQAQNNASVKKPIDRTHSFVVNIATGTPSAP